MFCNQCGKELKEGALFCTNCGAKQTPKNREGNTVDDFGRTIIIDSNYVEQGDETKDESFQSYNPHGSFNNGNAPQQAYGGQQNYYQQNNATYQQPPVVKNTYSQNDQSYYEVIMRMGMAHMGASFGEAISLFFKNYVNFSGRASKGEYWWAFLFGILVSIPNSFLIISAPPIGGLVALGFMLPSLALCVRRMHDIGKHWHRMFIGFIPLAGLVIIIIDLCKDSDGDNQWGYGPYHN